MDWLIISKSKWSHLIYMDYKDCGDGKSHCWITPDNWWDIKQSKSPSSFCSGINLCLLSYPLNTEPDQWLRTSSSSFRDWDVQHQAIKLMKCIKLMIVLTFYTLTFLLFPFPLGSSLPEEASVVHEVLDVVTDEVGVPHGGTTQDVRSYSAFLRLKVVNFPTFHHLRVRILLFVWLTSLCCLPTPKIPVVWFRLLSLYFDSPLHRENCKTTTNYFNQFFQNNSMEACENCVTSVTTTGLLLRQGRHQPHLPYRVSVAREQRRYQPSPWPLVP